MVEDPKLPEGDWILGLDLGTTTGFSIITRCAQRTGACRLSVPKETPNATRSTQDIRFTRLRSLVAGFFRDAPPTDLDSRVVVAWEDVQFCSYAYQFQLWCTLRAAVWAAIEDAERKHGFTVKRLSVPVGTLKKFATGSGAADKNRMLTAGIERGIIPPQIILPGLPVDDNAVDAHWIARWALTQ